MAKTVLYIDYNPRSIGRIRPVLQALGLQVQLAHDGLIGIDMFHMHNPDLVLLQDLIPRKHGFEVCSEIKNTIKGQSTPVVLLTRLTNGKRCEIHDTGCDAFLEEPAPDQSLIQVIRKFIPEVESMHTVVDQGDHSSSSEWQNIHPCQKQKREVGYARHLALTWGTISTPRNHCFE
jgi:CheY-like chemotaxis protein